MKLSKETEKILLNTDILNEDLSSLPFGENFRTYHKDFVKEVSKEDFVVSVN